MNETELESDGGFGTDTLIQPKLIEPGDHERFSHYVRKEKIVESAVMGTPVVALCGKVWVPGRDPKQFPVCPKCKEIYNLLPPGKEDQN
jgi:hypothetical protein